MYTHEGGTAAPAAVPDSGSAQPVSTAAASGEPAVTEQDIRDLEEGEEAASEIFVSSAPPEVVEEHRARQTAAQAMIEKLQTAMQSLAE